MKNANASNGREAVVRRLGDECQLCGQNYQAYLLRRSTGELWTYLQDHSDIGRSFVNIYEIDGGNFRTLEQFYDEVERVIIGEHSWGRNLDAFDDILRGGFGTPAEGFHIRWKNSELSRQYLGYGETVRVLENMLLGCHPLSRKNVEAKIEMAKQSMGNTVFDTLVEILKDHGVDGAQREDNVSFSLD